MAQVNRTAAVTPSSSAQRADRAVAASRYAGSSENAVIDELNAQVGVSGHQFPFDSQDFDQQGSGQRRGGTQGRGARPRHFGRVDTAFDTFAAVLEAGNEQRAAGGVTGGRAPAINVSRAIDTYETNARVIAGENRPRGRSMSYVL